MNVQNGSPHANFPHVSLIAPVLPTLTKQERNEEKIRRQIAKISCALKALLF